MGSRMERTVPFLHGCISLVAFVVSLVLIIYMLVTFVAGMFDTAMLLSETIFMTSAERQSVFLVLNANFLYNLAVLIVLMKANTVVTAYMRAHEISVKHVVELVIIAIVLEFTFNASSHSDTWQYVAALLAASLFAVYAFRYHVQSIIQRLASITEEEEVVDAVPETVAPRVPRTKRVPAPKPLPDKPAKLARPARKLAAK